jgi:hypothetical protein
MMHETPTPEGVGRTGNPGLAKGTIFLHLREFVVTYHGNEAWERLLAELPASDRTMLDGNFLLVGGWYPVGVWNRLLNTFLPANYADVDAGMTKVARYISEKDLNMLFKIILKMGSPQFLLKRTGSIWSRYFDSGALTHHEVEPRHWRLTLEVPAGPDIPDRLTCGPGVAAWITQGLRLTGVDGTVEHVDTHLGRTHVYEYRATW